MSIEQIHKCWAVLHRSDNLLDGYREWIGGEANGTTRAHLFPTRDAARKYITEHYGYLASRPDLRREPHGWMMPRAVRVEVSIRMVDP